MRTPRRLGAALVALALVGAAAAMGAVPAAAAPSRVVVPGQTSAGHALIQGSGSSWAANAVQQWISDVTANGLQVVFTSSGSAQGRKDFANNTTDFGVSDIGYQGTDPASGASDTSQGRAYAYLPIVSGGTSFPYQLHGAGGKLITNLRLSGPTLAGIFTGKITNWRDPAIIRDNNGDPTHEIPDETIIPVVHSEGSGSSYQFTKYLDTEDKSEWENFAGTGATEYFPVGKGNEVAENGSDGVINFLTSAAGNGSIGFDEYSYALGKGYPVAKVLNSGGYYTLPNQYNVAVALTQAQINMDKTNPNYLLQNLTNVYTYKDKRTYPLSSYSYMIIPTGAKDQEESTAKRQTIADYLYYSICRGQAEMGKIGYSPLPVNLVQAGFQQIALLKQADKNVVLSGESITSCDNPTFEAGDPSANYLAKVAPEPPACDAAGKGPCVGNGNTGQANPNNGKVATTGDSGATGSAGTGASDTSGISGSSGTSVTSGTSGSSSTGSTGTLGSGSSRSSGASGTLGSTGNSGTTESGVSLTGSQASTQQQVVPDDGTSGLAIAVVAGVLLLGLLVAPPVVGIVLARGRK